ncbi:SDR family NAD(P)-dependent oxidoreductase [soil metagenome]
MEKYLRLYFDQKEDVFMPVIAIVGAGSGLGASIARVFGKNGFQVALVARSQKKLDEIAAQLADEGIEAAGFAADLLDAPTLVSAFEKITERFGPVDVLEFSPAVHARGTQLDMVGPVEVTRENLQPQFDFYVYGAIAAAAQVLPGMLEAGAGTLLFTTGGGSITPVSMMGNVNTAAAALRNWVLNLNQTIADRGVYAAHVAISAWIGGGKPEAEADVIAQAYYDLYTSRDKAELHYVAL